MLIVNLSLNFQFSLSPLDGRVARGAKSSVKAQDVALVSRPATGHGTVFRGQHRTHARRLPLESSRMRRHVQMSPLSEDEHVSRQFAPISHDARTSGFQGSSSCGHVTGALLKIKNVLAMWLSCLPDVTKIENEMGIEEAVITAYLSSDCRCVECWCSDPSTRALPTTRITRLWLHRRSISTVSGSNVLSAIRPTLICGTSSTNICTRIIPNTRWVEVR